MAVNQSINNFTQLTNYPTTTTTTTPILSSHVNSKNEKDKVKEVGKTISNYNYSGELFNNYNQINPYKKQKISDDDGGGGGYFGYPMEHPECQSFSFQELVSPDQKYVFLFSPFVSASNLNIKISDDGKEGTTTFS
ncbi:hypothetical protein DDB_G0270348 [Dictyostelium discoideum AX4]|uniref:Uncharacterized protein n=1 Tax=Dictyostelium discoideum TaxID=44689 RepID=Q55BV6_DICDI|nr:hypothetical protein DDB_G0270348 [Dictyostelium discoideum AX4]EAL72524.1 hypothetical protein DDB_G0270348 [Dictyostelium discoideum AX4]|eukprot:XP_646725.1 hypothetical protein DDB_G0270348 [Dictyostelium discoideum AX4]